MITSSSFSSEDASTPASHVVELPCLQTNTAISLGKRVPADGYSILHFTWESRSFPFRLPRHAHFCSAPILLVLFKMLPISLLSLLSLAGLAKAETWSLSQVSSHFMGSNSGIAGGAWPPGTEFNTTVEFILQRIPGDLGTVSTAVCCSACWQEPDYPTSWMACNDSSTRWRLPAQEGMTAANFTLEILRADIGK